jgi:hypothetical protein
MTTPDGCFVAQTLATMRDRGLLDQAVVVVTADHGISFAPGTAARIIGRGNDPWIMWVPLFIKEPGQRTARVDDRNWEHVDLLPTLADYAGVRLPWPVDGRSALRGAPRTDTAKHFVAVRERGRARRLTVDGLGAFRDVRPDRGQVPAYVQGTVPAGVAPGTLLALAVNGRIGTVARVAPEGTAGTLRFAGMLPGSGFTAGANRLEVLAVDGGGLRRLPLKGS